MRSGSCESLLRDFLKLKLGMLKFRAIKISTKKILAWISLASEKYTVFMHEEIIISLTTDDTLTLVSA